jgi:hypothetical protein
MRASIALTSALVGVLLISVATSASAECSATSSAAECLCDGPKPKEAVFLPLLRKGAIDVRNVLCVQNGDQSEVRRAVENFARSHVGWFTPFGGFEKEFDPLRDVEAAMRATPGAPALGIGANDELTLGGIVYRPRDTNGCANIAKEKEKTCGDVLDEFLSLYTYAQTTDATADALTFAKDVSERSADWKDFLDSSRSQTPLEVWLNSIAFDGTKSSTFSNAPDYQWIVLHPNAVVENVKDAVDGEETQEALVVDLVGINFWRQKRWYVPSGASIVTAYSDRNDTEDWGYGLAIHFRSKYSVGWADHDGDGGFFISFDLLDLVADKKKMIEKYKP